MSRNVARRDMSEMRDLTVRGTSEKGFPVCLSGSGGLGMADRMGMLYKWPMFDRYRPGSDCRLSSEMVPQELESGCISDASVPWRKDSLNWEIWKRV
jgi:hypothetical protein